MHSLQLTELKIRWHQGIMFVKLTVESCPPLALFLDDGKGNSHWNKRMKVVVDQGYYIELQKKRTGANSCERYAVVEVDALLWLLVQRNRKSTGATSIHIPTEKIDKRMLHEWQHWTRQASALFTASKLGYTPGCSSTIDDTMLTDLVDDTCSPLIRPKHNGKRRLQVESEYDEQAYQDAAKKRIKAQETETPAQKEQRLADLLIETHASGMMDLKNRMERQVTASRRLFAHYCSRSTLYSRDRLRNALECESTTATAMVQEEYGKRPADGAPPRFKTPEAIDAFLLLVEEEWTCNAALSSQYDSCVEACEAGFALSTECNRFWGNVRTRARASVGKENGVPTGVLDTLLSSKKHDPMHIRHAIEAHVGSCFDTRKKRERHRIHHEFGEYVCEQPHLIPNTRKEQRESDLQTESYGEIRRVGPASAAHMQPITADQVENRVAFRNRLNPAGNAAMSDATLSAKLQQGEMRQALLLGVEREIVTENGRCKRLARFLDPRLLAAQWVLQWEKAFAQTEGNQTIVVAMEPWMDGKQSKRTNVRAATNGDCPNVTGTTIGGHSSVASQITFRPQDEELFDEDLGHTRYLRSRILNICDDTRETREVYQLLVSIAAVQMHFAATNGVPLHLH